MPSNQAAGAPAGRKLDKLYMESRARWEPMYEITQIKGDGEAHPFLSPDDAFADYETWDAGNLDRIQIVKRWLDGDGKTRERVYDVAWSLGRNPDATGVLPPVGNTVDVEAANWTNTIGASELGTVWTDPNFDPEESASYYARVLEIPTPRWIVYDAFRFGIEIPGGAETTHQERVYTATIWYSP